MEVVVTRAEFAEIAGITPDSVTRLTGQGLPVLSTGGRGRGDATKIDAVAAMEWIRDRDDKRSGLDVERERHYAAMAEKNELANAVRRGELVEAGDIEREWSSLILACRERLLSLPSTALQRGLVETTETEDGLIGLVREALDELAGRGNKKTLGENSSQGFTETVDE